MNNGIESVKRQPYNISPVLLEIILAASSSQMLRVLIELHAWTNIEIRYLLELTYGDLVSVPQGKISIYYTHGLISDIPIGDGIRELLQPYVGKGGKWDFLFTHEDGSSWSEEYVSSMVTDLSQRTGIECTLDDLTYSFYRMEADSIFSPTQTKKKRKYVKDMMTNAESVR